MNRPGSCNILEHQLARRHFLGTAGFAAAGGLAGWNPLAALGASELPKQQKRIVQFYLHGGVSQLETWDPKPGTNTGGPFRSIPTSVPGLHISELLPNTAKIMHHLAVLRSVNTKEDDHGKGDYLMMTGRRHSPAADYPQLGAIASKMLAPPDSPLPGYVSITLGGGGGRNNDSAYLGPKYASVALGNGQPPANMAVPDYVSADNRAARQALLKATNQQFSSRRKTAKSELYTYSYEQAERLVSQKDVFDLSKESDADHQRYGTHDFGRFTLLARRMVEHGVSAVKVWHANYDSHNENFDFHAERMGEFDRTFATFVSDIAERGLLDSTLIIVMSEFGRTPNINHLVGRDHWSAAWSVVMGGAGIQRGAVFGKTNHNGTEVAEGQVDHGRLFHTWLQAVGINSLGTVDVDGRKLPIADPAETPIRELLA